MGYRAIASVAGIFVAMLIVASAVRAADVQIKEGTVVSAATNTLVIVDVQGKQQSFEVESNVPVRINGKPGKLEDLEKSARVKVTIDKQGKVMAVETVDALKASAH